MSNVKVQHFGNRITPQQCLLDSLDLVDKIEAVVVVIKHKDGVITYGCSKASYLTHLGMLRVADTLMIDDMTEET